MFAKRMNFPQLGTLLGASVLCFTLLASTPVQAALPHNYTVGPSPTMCDFQSIHAAVAGAASGDTITLGAGQSYTDHVHISGKNLTIRAGATCLFSTAIAPTSDATASSTFANWTAGASDNAIEIDGTSNVTLIGLFIHGGARSSGGGGIAFNGLGSLTLNNCYVSANTANLGGGISFYGTPGAPALLTILADTTITGNNANDSGGGIYLAGNSQLIMTQTNIEIFGNHALGNFAGASGLGGGLAVVGPARADIGTPINDGGFGVINTNTALYGGGISITASTDEGGSARVRLFTTDAGRPAGISNNTASNTGGGIYLKPYREEVPFRVNSADLLAWDFRIDHNHAPEGAAIYSDLDSTIVSDVGGSVYLNDVNIAGDDYPTGTGVRCPHADVCNVINDNETTDPTSGSTILMQNAGYLIGNGFTMRRNAAGSLIHTIESGPTQLFNCLLADNTVRNELIYHSSGGAILYLNSCTFANDLIGATHVIHSASGLSLSDSIIAEPGTLALDYSGASADLDVNYVLSNDITTLPNTGTGVIPGTPNFVDRNNGDYHLTSYSLGVDFAPTSDAFYIVNTHDLDGHARSVDAPFAGNVFGTQDLGAFELINKFSNCGAADSVFCNGYDP